MMEMSNAVQAAEEFYNAHPNETLILVTADHETGGMAIGYKTTNYDTFLTNLTHQKMSYAKFDSTYVENYIANKTPFEHLALGRRADLQRTSGRWRSARLPRAR